MDVRYAGFAGAKTWVVKVPEGLKINPSGTFIFRKTQSAGIILSINSRLPRRLLPLFPLKFSLSKGFFQFPCRKLRTM
jgi:hypothetical protein